MALHDDITRIIRQERAESYACLKDRDDALAAAIINGLNLREETVHVEGEWGIGARDEVQITGSVG